MSTHAQRQEQVADDGAAEFLAYRLATETFLRGVDLLNEAAGGSIAHGLLLNALWCLELRDTVAPPASLILSAQWHRAMSIHDLARALSLPYSTVYRQLGQLITRGIAVRNAGGAVTFSAAFADSPAGRTFRSGMMASFTRLVVSLHRIGFLSGSIASLERKDGLGTAQRDIVFRAGLETILRCLLLTAQFYDDLVTGLVFKLVATANTKHLLNSSGTVAIPDDQRRPISVYNAAKALHLPYETTRRITKQLLARNVLQQRGNQGLVVPAHVHIRTENAETQTASFQALAAGIAQLAHAGIRLRPAR